MTWIEGENASYDKEEKMNQVHAEVLPDLLEIYLNEVKAIRPLAEGEEEDAIGKARDGDKSAIKRLTEAYLMPSLFEVKAFTGGSMDVTEMIGVANLALVRAVQSYLKTSDPAHALSDAIKKTVRNALEEAVTEANKKRKEEEEISNRINILSEEARAAAKEYGREGTPEELAKRLEMTEEEVRMLLKMSLQAMA